MLGIFETPRPSVALVIGTFAAVPYVHVALESWRRYCPSIPVLVSDDGSPAAPELRALCLDYGAEFRGNPQRSGHKVGDLTSYLHGLEWAESLGVDLLVKMSRRFIPLHNWVPDLQSLAWQTQYATYSQRCLHFRFGFRTECIGFHVASWCSSEIQDELRKTVEHSQAVFVEGYLHRLARRVQGFACDLNRQFEVRNPRPADSDGYGVWEIMPDRRLTRKPDVLWHDCDEPLDYCRVASLWGLRYNLEDFTDPNRVIAFPSPVAVAR